MNGLAKICLEGYRGWDFLAHLAGMGLKRCGKENGGTGGKMGEISPFCVEHPALVSVPASRNVEDVLVKEFNN